jgi:hypothetical protein
MITSELSMIPAVTIESAMIDIIVSMSVKARLKALNGIKYT